MGTRHLQTVFNQQGECKLANYGQWDGYPEGQGLDILKYLRQADFTKYNEELSKLREVTEDEVIAINSGIPEYFIGSDRSWKKEYPYLSRDCGADIHQMIEEGMVKFILNGKEYTEEEKADSRCEGFYTINIQANEFISEYNGCTVVFPLDNLPTDGDYLNAFAHLGEEDEE